MGFDRAKYRYGQNHRYRQSKRRRRQDHYRGQSRRLSGPFWAPHLTHRLRSAGQRHQWLQRRARQRLRLYLRGLARPAQHHLSDLPHPYKGPLRSARTHSPRGCRGGNGLHGRARQAARRSTGPGKGPVRIYTHRLPAVSGLADDQRAERGRFRPHSGAVRILCLRRREQSQRFYPRGAALSQPPPRNRGRLTHPVRRSLAALSPRGPRGAQPLRRQGLSDDHQPQHQLGRGPRF